MKFTKLYSITSKVENIDMLTSIFYFEKLP